MQSLIHLLKSQGGVSREHVMRDIGSVPPPMVREMAGSIINNTLCLGGKGAEPKGVTAEGAVKFLEIMRSR